MRLFKMRLISQFRDDESGSVLIIVGLAVPVLLGAATIGVDLSRMYVTKNKLASTADAAALAGVSAIVEDKDPSQIETYTETGACTRYDDEFRAACLQAIHYAISNTDTKQSGYVLLDDDVVVGCWEPGEDFEELGSGCTTSNAKAVQVTTERANGRADASQDNALDLILAPAAPIGREVTDIRARATAAAVGGGNGRVPCLSAKSGNFTIRGDVSFDLPNCGIETNQTLDIRGNSTDLTVGGVTYRDYNGGTGNSDSPADDFTDPGEVRQLGSGESLEQKDAPDDASSLDSMCPDKNNKYEGSSSCDLTGSGVYTVNGDLEIAGNARFFFPQGNENDPPKATRIIVDGDLTLRGTPSINGCFQISADNIEVAGTPDLESQACEDVDPAGPAAGSQEIRLVPNS